MFLSQPKAVQQHSGVGSGANSGVNEHCAVTDPVFEFGAGFDFPAFRVATTCEIQCRGQSQLIQATSPSEVLSSKTSPLELKPGNGGAYAPLAASLSLFSRRQCLAIARSRCGGLAQVERVEPQQVSSGTWMAKLPLGCSAEKQSIPVRSPVQVASVTSSGVAQKLTPGVQEAGPLDRVPPQGQALSGLPDSLVGSELKNTEEKAPSVCAKVCFGDCVSLDVSEEYKSQYLLASHLPYGRDEVCFRADSLKKWIARQESSLRGPAMKQAWCEEYFMKSAVASKMMWAACSAARIDGVVACKGL
jgi:hypothetical protein